MGTAMRRTRPYWHIPWGPKRTRYRQCSTTCSTITPLVYTNQQKVHRNFHIALAPVASNTDGWKKVIDKVEKAWKEVYPEEEFSYTFFDESIAAFYKKEQQTAGLLNWSAGLTVFISCLGLL